MSRIRTIKPDFFTSEDIVGLSLLARLLYIALWCEADRDGRMVWRPKTFKIRYLPADDCSIQELCEELVSKGMIVLYGNGYAHIPTFKAHQHINARESISQLPEPDTSTTRQPRVGTRAPRDSDVHGGREGNGKEGNEDNAQRFDQFWTAYPNKSAKQVAIKAFDKAGIDDGILSVMLADIQIRKSSESWQKDGGKYIPNPATYLNQRRWEDEGTTSATSGILAGAI
jgi:hypothetical protein